jgi:serine/threonine protein kinase/tetratricopeptide (TPR) repeat protein
MTEERWQYICLLYERASQYPAESRRSFLAEEASHDAEAIQEVLRLLDLAESAGDFLERGVGLDLRQVGLTPTQALEIGQVLSDRFEIEAFLGAGGMGEVYRARDLDLRVRVAIKTLQLDRVGDEDAQERLRREALVARRVTHPNVCRIFDAGRHLRYGQPGYMTVLTMELLEGPTLRDYVRANSPMAEQLVRSLAQQVCAGLAAAHEQGVIHRDLKSANIILVPAENGPHRAVITDFGLARRALADSASAGHTQASSLTGNMLMGTPDYMAPELLRGQPASVQSDIYALGVIIFEMAAGYLPYTGTNSLDQLLKRFLDPPPSLRARVPGISRNLDAVVTRCLHADPAHRFISVSEVSRALSNPIPMLGLSRRQWIVGAAATAGVATAATLWMQREVDVIVFPIENQTGETASTYLSQGTTTELIRQLAQVPRVRVIPYYQPRSTAPRELPAKYALSGKLEKGPRLSMELTSCADGSLVWSQQFAGSQYQSSLQLQMDLARNVVRAFSGVRGGTQRLASIFDSSSGTGSSVATQNAEAFDLYLRAMSLLRDRTLNPTLQAVTYLERAIELDPRFALGYAALSEAQIGLIENAFAPVAELLLKGHGYAERAVREGPQLAETHLALASFRQMAWDWDGADAAYRETLRLRPNFARARQWYAGMRLQFGASPAILADMHQALLDDPYDAIIRNGYSLGLFYCDQYAEAIHVQEESAQQRNSLIARHHIGCVYAYQASLATDPARSNFLQRALEQVDAIAAIESKSTSAPVGLRFADRLAAIVYAYSRQPDLMAPPLARLESDLPSGRMSPAVIARVYAATGQFDRAFELLDQAVARKDRILLNVKVNPFYRALHPDPRFTTLLRTMRLIS